MSMVIITINGKEFSAKTGEMVVDVARKNGIYIPTLCNMEGVIPQGSCRICTCLIDGRTMAACTTPVSHRMNVETNNAELEKIRTTIVELLFAEGNHYCPTCERSGNCDLQALAYRFNVLVSQFKQIFPTRNVDAKNPKILIDHNRCIQCKRCIRRMGGSGKPAWFSFKDRGHKVKVNIDHELTADFTDEMAQKAMDTCPVGAILKKEKGFDVPIGRRKYDTEPIGTEIEKEGAKL